ncbi:Anoctamin-7 [Branchiostoma belcheri]|nr:Anoctamin-7 [Branchiostoma belcheri]
MTSPRGNSQKASESSGSEFAMFWSHDYQETGEREGRDLMSSVVVGIRKLVGNAKYKEFRDKDGSFSLFYWRLLAIRLGFVILFEHVVFFISRLIDIMVPDIPESLEIKIKRERYLAKQALQDQEHIMAGGLAGVGEEDEGGDDEFAVTTQGRKGATRMDAGNVYLSVPTADV